MKATKPSDYLHIRAWGMRLLSFEYYIVDQQERAFAAGAPIDAIYERDGVWRTVGDCHPDVRDLVNKDVEYLRTSR